MKTPTDEAVLLLDHGSRDPAARVEFAAIAEALQARCDLPLSPAYLELADPPVLDRIEVLAGQGIRKIWALSAFLLPAGHVKSDLPTALIEAQRTWDVEIAYGRPFGLHPSLLYALRDRWREAVADLPPVPKQETAVLVIGRGASDPDANSEVAKLARLMYETGDCGQAQAAYVSVTGPSVPEGLAQCAALGARRVVVLPFFLCTGVLIERIGQQARAWAVAHPEVQVAVAAHMGQHPGVIQALVDRLRELRSGEDRSVWCDRCVYRAPLPGHAASVRAPVHSDEAHGLRHGSGNGHSHSQPHEQGHEPEHSHGAGHDHAHDSSHSHSHTHLKSRTPEPIPPGPSLAPDEIARRSFEIIAEELQAQGVWVSPEAQVVVRRVIHTTGDFEYANLIEFSPGALETGRAALATGLPIVCDVRMVQMGLTGLEAQTVCCVNDEDVRAESLASGLTRSALGLRKALAQQPRSVIVVGNAPTALREALRLIDEDTARPPLIIGAPVGFVDAAESKEALRRRPDVEWILIRGRKGGSGVAAAIVNALAGAAG